MSRELWGFIFLMVIMKVPIAYLVAVVWYACKSPPPPEPAFKLVEEPEPQPACPWRMQRRNPDKPRRPRVGPRPGVQTARAPNALAERR
jgi:hypothetical protein